MKKFLIILLLIISSTIFSQKVAEPVTEAEAEELSDWLRKSRDDAQIITDLLQKKKNILKKNILKKDEIERVQNEINEHEAFLKRYAVVQNLLKKGSVLKLLAKIKVRESLAAEQQDYQELKQLILEPLQQALPYEDVAVLQGLMEEFEKKMALSAIKEHVSHAVSTEHKLAMISEARTFMYKAKDLITKALEKDYGENETFKKVLIAFDTLINNSLETLDKLSIELYLKQADLGQKIKNIFELKVSKKTVKDEREDIRQMKQKIKPAVDLAAEIEKLTDEQFDLAEEIKQLRKKETFEANREQLEQRARKIVNKAIQLNRKLSPQQKKLLNDTFKKLKGYTGTLAAKANRYRGNYPTLFDSQVVEYATELKGSHFEPHEVYEALGLRPGASAQEIEKAYEEKRKEENLNRPEWKAARNASTIIRDSVGRETYDAFLKDYEMLRNLGIDPYNKKKSQVLLNFLNKESELSKLELSKNVRDEIDELAFQVEEMSRMVGNLYTSQQEISFEEQIDTIENALQKAFQFSSPMD